MLILCFIAVVNRLAPFRGRTANLDYLLVEYYAWSLQPEQVLLSWQKEKIRHGIIRLRRKTSRDELCSLSRSPVA